MSNRPKFLAVIGTLSVINGIYGIISSLVNAIAPPDVDERLLSDLFQKLESLNVPFEAIQADVEAYFLNTMLNMGNIAAGSFLGYGFSLVGALLMLRLNKVGFILYVAGQICLAITPVIFGGFNSFGLATLALMGTWNALWIFAYATQLKHFYK